MNRNERRLREALTELVDVLGRWEDVIIQHVGLNQAYVRAKFALAETRDPPRKQARVKGGYKRRQTR